MKTNPKLIDYSLPLCMVGTLAALVSDNTVGLWVARPAIALYVIQHWHALPGLGKTLIKLILAIAVALLVFHPSPWPLIFDAWDSFSFFATFITALGLLQVAASGSPLVRSAGHTLVQQKPTQRYPTLSIGTALFGMIINVGVLSLFTTMVTRSNSLTSANGSQALQEAREKRMSLAILRGFALAPLTSPLSVTLAVILKALPQLTWLSILPVAMPMAIFFFLLGWATDWWQRPKHLASHVKPSSPPPLTPLYWFAGLAFLIALSVFVVAFVLQLSLPVAVLFACPLSAFIWLAFQFRRLRGGLGVKRAGAHVKRNVNTIFSKARSEVSLLGASACIGTLVTPLIDQQALAALLQSFSIEGVPFAFATLATMVGLAQVGLNPIVTATLIASLFPDTQLIGLHPAVFAVTLMCGWSLSMITSPFTASLTLVSGHIGRPSFEVGWRWNAYFFLLLVPVISFWLTAAQWWLN